MFNLGKHLVLDVMCVVNELLTQNGGDGFNLFMWMYNTGKRMQLNGKIVNDTIVGLSCIQRQIGGDRLLREYFHFVFIICIKYLEYFLWIKPTLPMSPYSRYLHFICYKTGITTTVTDIILTGNSLFVSLKITTIKRVCLMSKSLLLHHFINFISWVSAAKYTKLFGQGLFFPNTVFLTI